MHKHVVRYGMMCCDIIHYRIECHRLTAGLLVDGLLGVQYQHSRIMMNYATLQNFYHYDDKTCLITCIFE